MHDATHRLYRTARWQAVRQRVLSDTPLCTYCASAGRTVPAIVVDHVTPHRGDVHLFWSGPFQALCKPCHDGAKQREDISGRAIGVTVDGRPIDPTHRWNNDGKVLPKKPGTPTSHPAWFRPVSVPLTIVCGPPASGKSTYVANHVGPSDRVICFDTIAVSMFGKPGEQRVTGLTVSQVGDILRARNEMLGDLMRAGARDRWPAAWLIVSEPSADSRAWWAETVKPQAIVVMETPAEVCMARAKAAAAAGDVRPIATDYYIRQWWSKYTRREGDHIVAPAMV